MVGQNLVKSWSKVSQKLVNVANFWPRFDNLLVKCYPKRGRSKVSQVDNPLTNIRLIISGQCYECSINSSLDVIYVSPNFLILSQPKFTGSWRDIETSAVLYWNFVKHVSSSAESHKFQFSFLYGIQFSGPAMLYALDARPKLEFVTLLTGNRSYLHLLTFMCEFTTLNKPRNEIFIIVGATRSCGLPWIIPAGSMRCVKPT